jgi:hypothetical protein
MWNEKAARKSQANELRRNLDAFDLEAERQGNATGFFNRNNLRPQLGRRISKESRKANGYAATADLKATRHIVAATAQVLAERRRVA